MAKDCKAILGVRGLPKHAGGVLAPNEADFKIYADERTASADHNSAGFLKGAPVIVVSYYLRQVFNLVDRIAIFRQGWSAGVLDAKNASDNDFVAVITGVDQGAHKDASYI